MTSAAKLSTFAVALLFTSGASAQEPIRIGLAVPNNVFYTPIYAAEALGYYKDAGVKPELTVYRGGAASQEGLSAGAADLITYFPAGAGLAISKGAKQKIVAAIDPQPHGWHLLVPANSDIKSVRDLDGKKVGVATKAGTADMFALWSADRAGVKIATIPVGGGGMVPAMRGGQVDAIVQFPGLSLQLVAFGEARSILDFGKEMDPTIPDALVASQTLIDERPEVLRGTLNAIYKALDYTCSNREWGLKFLKDFTKEKDDRVNELVYKDVLCQQSKDGVIRKEWITSSLGIAAKVWGLSELGRVNPELVYTDRFVPAGK